MPCVVLTSLPRKSFLFFSVRHYSVIINFSAGSWTNNGTKLIGRNSGIVVIPYTSGAIEINHFQGVGEDRQKITILIQVSTNDTGEDVYDMTSSITKTRYFEDGDELEETDEVKTRKRLTPRGSVYMTRDSKLARTLRNVVGHEFIDEEVTTEVQVSIE